MLSPSQLSSTAVWPIPGDVPDLQAIVWSQAATIKAQAALIDGYQTDLNNAQAIPNATGVGTASGTPATTLTMTSVTGVIKIGATVTGTGISPGTWIAAQVSGTTGGNGTYQTNIASTASGAALTFSPGGGTSSWPIATDAPDLMLISQDQTAILRMQNALLQAYQTLLNDSDTTPPGSGP